MACNGRQGLLVGRMHLCTVVSIVAPSIEFLAGDDLASVLVNDPRPDPLAAQGMLQSVGTAGLGLKLYVSSVSVAR